MSARTNTSWLLVIAALVAVAAIVTYWLQGDQQRAASVSATSASPAPVTASGQPVEDGQAGRGGQPAGTDLPGATPPPPGAGAVASSGTSASGTTTSPATASTSPQPAGTVTREMKLPDNLEVFLSGDVVRLPFPNGENFEGHASEVVRDDNGVGRIHGEMSSPRPGTFIFERFVLPDGSVALKGLVMFNSGRTLYRFFSRHGKGTFTEEKVP